MNKVENIPWVKDILKSYPELKCEVAEPNIELKGKDELQVELNKILLGSEIDTIEKQIKQVDDFRTCHLLRIAISEIEHSLPLMKVSDHLTYLAEAIINVVIERVWTEMISKYGTPACVIGDNICDMGFIVVGYGKFGGIEMGYASDLDLVFLHAGNWEDTQGGERSIDSTQFYIKMGQQALKILGGQTITGALYETDMRLRPDGTKGLLVQNIESYRDYLIERAQTWEHQALVRARAIIGDPVVIKRFEEIREEVLRIDRNKEKLKDEVKSMRERMIKELDKSDKDLFDLKQGKGGIVDIEFVVQYLTLLYAGKFSSFELWTDVVRLLEIMVMANIIDEDSSHKLQNAYLTYRSHVHKLSLQKKPNLVKEQNFSKLKHNVLNLCEQLLK